MATLDKSLRPDLRIAVAGLGAIGARVVEALDRGIDGLVLNAVSVKNSEKHQNLLANLTRTPAVLPIEALVDVADIVIECAPSKLVRSIVAPFVSNGKTAIVLSAGALLDHEDLVELAKQNGGQIVVPTGALIGLDAVSAAAVGKVHSVRMVTRKPIRGLAGAPYIVDNNIDIEQITEPLKIFDGTAREAAKGFPANVNVVAALSLAGIGPDRTKIEIWADPSLTRNTHRIDVEIRFCPFFHVDRKYPLRKPKNGSHHRALGYCLSSQATCITARRNMTMVCQLRIGLESDQATAASIFAAGSVAYLIFLGTFLYAIGFVSQYIVPKTIDTGPTSPLRTALLINMVLMSIFAVQHSSMARQGFKKLLVRFASPAIERSTYVLLASLTLILLFWQWQPMPTMVWSIGKPVLAAVAIAGGFWAG